MKRKKTMLLVVLLMAVGFAAVSTTLYINGQTKISANDDDFNVYYSNAKVNGVQDKSVITDDTHISFTTTLETLGQKYELDYDVTNGSKNYDAELVMECTQGNEYLNVTNEFDTTTNLPSLQTRSGKLTLELIKSYAGEEDLEVTIDCTIDANAIERDSLGKVIPKFETGEEITLVGEKFNIISQTDDTVTMLAAYTIGKDFKQQEEADSAYDYYMSTSGRNWEYTPGPKEIDLNTYFRESAFYINKYVEYLEHKTGFNITGNFITMKELGELGCTINDDYSVTDDLTCANSEHAGWLVIGESWWTRSTDSTGPYVIIVEGDGSIDTAWEDASYARPIITIAKEDIINGVADDYTPPAPGPYDIGTAVTLSTEKFHIISSDDTNIKMISDYALGKDYKQFTESASNENNWLEEYSVQFSNEDVFYSLGYRNKEDMDIQKIEGPVKEYINNYESILKSELGVSSIEVDLIGYEDLYTLCGDDECYKLYDWFTYNQHLFWTKGLSGVTESWHNILTLYGAGDSYTLDFEDTALVRPVVTISKEDFDKLTN